MENPTTKVQVKRVPPPQGAGDGSGQGMGGIWPGRLQRPTRMRAAMSLGVAMVSDVISVAMEFVPPVQVGVDVATALVLWGLLGWRWALLPALIVEAIPVLAIFPTWTMVAGAYLALSKSTD